MDSPDEFVESFPPTRDDEPASLREDIVDELADHLESALQHQRLTAQDEESARSLVFGRFGDPRRLARQLWFEAMQEKIMFQRISLAINVLLGAICLTAVGMMWHVMEKAQAATRELAEESRATTRLLIDRLAQMPAQTPRETSAEVAFRSPDWNPVKAHLVPGEKGGPPVDGFVVRLSQRHTNSGVASFEIIAEERTGPDGVADLAVVRPGKYVLSAMNRSDNNEWFSTLVNVLPGSSQTVEIVCPPEKIEKVEVVVRVEVPEDLRSKDLYLAAEMVLGPRDFSGTEWRTGFNGSEAFDSRVNVVFAPDGRVGETFQGVSNQTRNGEFIQTLPTDSNGQGFAKPDERPLQMFKTKYFLKTIRIGPPHRPGNQARLDVAPSWMTVKSEWHFLPLNKRIYSGVFGDYQIESRDLAMFQTFHAESVQKNEWQIIVPDEVWDRFREDLKQAERISKETPGVPVQKNWVPAPAQ